MLVDLHQEIKDQRQANSHSKDTIHPSTGLTNGLVDGHTYIRTLSKDNNIISNTVLIGEDDSMGNKIVLLNERVCLGPPP